MSTLNGRKGPNVSQYLANLNAIPSETDIANRDDNYNLDAELDPFTNTEFREFLDFDAGNFLEQDHQSFSTGQQGEVEMANTGEQKGEEVKSLGLVNGIL